jgi:hypothetical protein
MSSRVRSAAKTIGYNLLVFFVLANLFYWSIPTVVTLVNLYKHSDSRLTRGGIPPAYSESEAAWVKRHWLDVAHLKIVYRSFIGWRTDVTQGETVHVDPPLLQRRTVNTGTSGTRTAYFFGGSTIWGVGSNDAGTIPSQFAALTGMHAENFGERSYTAHQGLVMLIQLLQAGHRPDLVVFYDGVNDVLNKCRNEIGVDSYDREPDFSHTFERSFRTDSFSYYFAPLMTLSEKIRLELSRSVHAEEYACQRDAAKAEAIAGRLVQDWQFAKLLTEAHGGKFIGLLQPVAFFSKTRLQPYHLPPSLATQYQAVYPIVRQKIAALTDIHDLISVLDVDEDLYIDFCHLAPTGNRLVAQKIAEIAGVPRLTQ